MQSLFKSVLIAALFVLVSESVAAQAWRQIQPLRTTRRQVERLLGPSKLIANFSKYEFDKEHVTIIYQTRSCKDDRQGWRVPIGTVTSVHIMPKTRVSLSSTQWDLSKFKKGPGDFDVPSSSSYVDEVNGITLYVDNDLLQSYSYGPKLSDKSKRCLGFTIADNKTCEQFAFDIVCSSRQISVGQTVTCHFGLIGVLWPASDPSVSWSVSDNASVERAEGFTAIFPYEVDQIRVLLKKPSKQRVTITARITTPNYCYPVTLEYLRIKKAGK